MFTVQVDGKEYHVGFLHYGEGVTRKPEVSTDWKKKFRVFNVNWELEPLELNTILEQRKLQTPKKKVKFIPETPKVGTVCFILQGEPGSRVEDKEEYVIGNAQKHECDKFSRASGRKYALAKALKATSFTDEQRKLIWHTYFPLCKDTRTLLKENN